ncbi:hypothetical protein [Pollutimonas bauzanensis]|uniref:hypothetical protein n=1 Tax=Pollutimonas bauzanensis TaxID=658167 RepID=UPI0033402970
MHKLIPDALLAALDEAALGLNQVEALAQLGLDDPVQAQAALLAIKTCVLEAKEHVMDIVQGLSGEYPEIRN